MSSMFTFAGISVFQPVCLAENFARWSVRAERDQWRLRRRLACRSTAHWRRQEVSIHDFERVAKLHRTRAMLLRRTTTCHRCFVPHPKLLGQPEVPLTNLPRALPGISPTPTVPSEARTYLRTTAEEIQRLHAVCLVFEVASLGGDPFLGGECPAMKGPSLSAPLGSGQNAKTKSRIGFQGTERRSCVTIYPMRTKSRPDFFSACS